MGDEAAVLLLPDQVLLPPGKPSEGRAAPGRSCCCESCCRSCHWRRAAGDKEAAAAAEAEVEGGD
jgi:hypothetical protein